MSDRVLDHGATLSPPVRVGVGSDDGRAPLALLVSIDGGGLGGHVDVAVGSEFRVQDDGAGDLRATDEVKHNGGIRQSV